TGVPSQEIVPSKSMSTVCTSGSCVGGGGVPTGKFRFTEWFWIGIVMINMMIKTSMTSINGVMLTSIITSGSPDPLPEPTFMPMIHPFLVLFLRRRDEADLGDAGTLCRHDHLAD